MEEVRDWVSEETLHPGLTLAEEEEGYPGAGTLGPSPRFPTRLVQLLIPLMVVIGDILP